MDMPNPTDTKLALLIEAWIMTTIISLRYDTAPMHFLLGGLRQMADGLRDGPTVELAVTLDEWIQRLETGSRDLAEELADLQSN